MADICDIADERVTAEIEGLVARRVRYVGESASECVECGEEIPERRRLALRGIKTCVDCAAAAERKR